MLNATIWNARDMICNLYIEELTDEQLIDNYYCRTCGHLKGDHTHALSDIQKLNTRFPEIDNIEEATLSIKSKIGNIQIVVYPPVNTKIEQDSSEDSGDSSFVSNSDDNFTTLSKQQASVIIDKIWTQLQEEQLSTRQAELDETCFTLNNQTIHWNECIYSQTRPPTGYSLWISMHGGGSCPAPVNDEQFRNQINLYNPHEGIWVVPRSPTDSWNQWHQEHIDVLFDRIIENYIMVKEINPNRVYILGYSAGGDGVYQLAPRMADRFAAAAMMAGHPNDALPYGLRNLPFAIFVGENDSGYNRNKMAQQWAEQLDTLQKSDPDAYNHYVNICSNMGHWMCGKDAEALTWMSQWTRNPWPKKVVWVQDDVTHHHFYWISLPDTIKPEQGQKITAEVNEQTITICTCEGIQQLTLRLSDALLDLDQSINVYLDGHGMIFQGRVSRTEQAIKNSFSIRADPACAATALLELSW
ncbi:unnamed protein product [Adineta steineri]|uniref:Uncharacterized protein n=1 Tax=Adineta steineri TaxID=433720 RepID=A0A818V9V9_9BILA|nr:unnamed protein product [Adineta steineri]CAF3708093.1 unnamed protein product [Adineta steineri]